MGTQWGTQLGATDPPPGEAGPRDGVAGSGPDGPRQRSGAPSTPEPASCPRAFRRSAC